MGLTERDNMVLIPAADTPHGHTGPLFNRLLYEDTTQNPPSNLQKQTKCYGWIGPQYKHKKHIFPKM